jgi:nucleoid DNA-binding protein
VPEFYDDIYDYLETLENSKSVNTKGLEDLVHKVYASTNLNKDACAILVKTFFSELRNAMLRGDSIAFHEVGKFVISSPSTDGKKMVIPRFYPSKKLVEKINGSE